MSPKELVSYSKDSQASRELTNPLKEVNENLQAIQSLQGYMVDAYESDSKKTGDNWQRRIQSLPGTRN